MAAANSMSVGRGSTLGVSEDEPTPIDFTVTAAAAKRDQILKLQAGASQTANLKQGDLLAVSAGSVAKVTADTTVTETPTVDVPVKRLDKAFIGSETFKHYPYGLVSGLTNITLSSSRGSIDLETLEDWEFKSYLADIGSATISGNIKLIAGNANYKLIRDYHDTGLQDNLFWQIVFRNAFRFRGCGHTTQLDITANASGNVIEGPIGIQVSGEYVIDNLV